MKKLIFLLGLVSPVIAQNTVADDFYIFTRQTNPDVVSPGSSMDVKNDTVVCSNTNVMGTITCHLMFYNVGSDSIEVAVKREEVSVAAGTTNAMTYQFIPYTPVTGITAPRACPNGDTAYFKADYMPAGNGATTTIRYKFFNVADTNDYFTTTVIFYPSFLGIINPEPGECKTYPNPATDLIRIEMPGKGVNGQVMVYNLLGENVLNMVMSENNTQPAIDIQGLAQGKYVYTIWGSNGVKYRGSFIKQ